MWLPVISGEGLRVTQIHVDRTQVLREAGETRFVMHCRVDGSGVQRGSVLSLPLSAGVDMTVPVDEVLPGEGGGVEIVVSCVDADEADFLLGLDLAGETLTAGLSHVDTSLPGTPSNE